MRFDPIGWAKTHKPQAALGVGAVGAVGIGLYRRRATASGASTASGVPVDATTAASVQPDTAGGIPFDPSAFNFDPGNYLGQISQEIGTTNSRLGQIEKNTKPRRKPATGGKAHKKPPAPKPKRKTPRKKRHP